MIHIYSNSIIFKFKILKVQNVKLFIERLPHKNLSHREALDSPRLAGGHAKVKTSEVTSSKCSRNKRARVLSWE